MSTKPKPRQSKDLTISRVTWSVTRKSKCAPKEGLIPSSMTRISLILSLAILAGFLMPARCLAIEPGTGVLRFDPEQNQFYFDAEQTRLIYSETTP